MTPKLSFTLWSDEFCRLCSDHQKQTVVWVWIMTHDTLSTLYSESCHLLLELRETQRNSPSCLALTPRLRSCLSLSQIAILFLSQGSLVENPYLSPCIPLPVFSSLERKDFFSSENLKLLQFWLKSFTLFLSSKKIKKSDPTYPYENPTICLKTVIVS